MYVNEEQGWHTLAGAVLTHGSPAHPRDHTMAVSVMRTIAANSRAMAQQGHRGSRQAKTSLDSLYNVCKQKRAVKSDLQSAIAGWFVQVQNASASDAAAFIAQLQEIGAALGGVRAPAGE